MQHYHLILLGRASNPEPARSPKISGVGTDGSSVLCYDLFSPAEACGIAPFEDVLSDKPHLGDWDVVRCEGNQFDVSEDVVETSQGTTPFLQPSTDLPPPHGSLAVRSARGLASASIPDTRVTPSSAAGAAARTLIVAVPADGIREVGRLH